MYDFFIILFLYIFFMYMCTERIPSYIFIYNLGNVAYCQIPNRLLWLERLCCLC